MSRYFMQDTPLAAFERMMTDIPRPENGRENASRDAVQRQQTQNPRHTQEGIDNAGSDASAYSIHRYSSG